MIIPYSKSLEMTGGLGPDPKPGQVVTHGGVLGRGRFCTPSSWS